MKSPTTGRQFTAEEIKIVELGFPPFLILDRAERKAIWDRNPVKTLPAFFDPRIEKDQELRAAQKREATAKRIYELRKSKGLIDDPAGVTSQTQEDNVADKYTIWPLDKYGHPVMRAVTSVPADAEQEAIDAKVLAAVERGGKKVVAVTLKNTLGEVTLAWSVDAEGVVAPADVEPYRSKVSASASANAEPETADADAAPADANVEPEAATGEESDMAKAKKSVSKVKKTKAPRKAKVAKVKAPRKAKVVGEFKKGSKMEIVYNLFTRKSGVTTDEMLKATGWKIVGMAQQAKACGLKIKKEKTDKGTRYFAI